jgi:hypothetical protein
MPGVFALWDNDEVVYIGRATAPGSIRGALFERLKSQHRSTPGVSHYAWEICLDPALRERELLDEHKHTYQALPRYNRPKA